MRAKLNIDIILGWVSTGGVEVGVAPAGVGLERLRYNGAVIVDLADLSTIHVEKISGVFVLHCISVPRSQPVIMTYADRKVLYDDNGTYKIRTAQEVKDKNIDDYKLMLENNVRRHLDKIAVEKGFDNVISARTYASYDNEYKDEGRAMLDWSAKCWVEYDKVINDVISESIEPLVVSEFINSLPDYEFSKEVLNNYRALILRRADSLEKKGDVVEAQLLRLKVL